jgi:short-subunit dehydrogenase involved in D-alanine esterification of teichoic acids
MKNSNLNIVITGGGSSIGASLVKKLSKKNRVCVLDIKFEISKNKNIFLYKCDVTKNKIIKKTFKKIYSRFKHIDVLINNAGWIATFPIYNPLKVKNKIHSIRFEIEENPLNIRIPETPFFSNFYRTPLRFFIQDIYIF